MERRKAPFSLILYPSPLRDDRAATAENCEDKPIDLVGLPHDLVDASILRARRARSKQKHARGIVAGDRSAIAIVSSTPPALKTASSAFADGGATGVGRGVGAGEGSAPHREVDAHLDLGQAAVRAVIKFHRIRNRDGRDHDAVVDGSRRRSRRRVVPRRALRPGRPRSEVRAARRCDRGCDDVVTSAHFAAASEPPKLPRALRPERASDAGAASSRWRHRAPPALRARRGSMRPSPCALLFSPRPPGGRKAAMGEGNNENNEGEAPRRADSCGGESMGKSRHIWCRRRDDLSMHASRRASV